MNRRALAHVPRAGWPVRRPNHQNHQNNHAKAQDCCRWAGRLPTAWDGHIRRHGKLDLLGFSFMLCNPVRIYRACCATPGILAETCIG